MIAGAVQHGEGLRSGREGRLPAWQVLSQASERGSAPSNEDAAGAWGSQAWVLDGSAFFAGPPRISDTSEGAWLVATIDRWLRDPALADLPLLELAGALAAELRASDAALGPAPPERGPGEGPSAVFALLRLRQDGEGFRLDAMLLGDVCVLIADRGAVGRWTDERIQPFEARTIAAAAAAGRAQGAVIAPQALAQVIENRRFLNREGGYWAINPTLPWQPGLLFFSRTVSADAKVLLATDGFMRLVDVVRRYDDGGLVKAVSTRGAAALIAELREIERDDADASRFARVKIHDDATALLVGPAGSPATTPGEGEPSCRSR